ncbi:SDR family oxidoreductase [Coralloluteibacterium stylophorae]|nr:SDR family oxidoreductase [Coralloluteibacterium stylophorae]
MSQSNQEPTARQTNGQPPQQQAHQPGSEAAMDPRPITIRDDYRGSGKLDGRVALITGGDSGIGRAVAVHFAREGADVAIVYLDETEDARETRRLVEAEGRRCHAIAGDLGDPDVCRRAVAETVQTLGQLDILVNNAAEQHEVDSPEELTPEQIERTFRTNIFAYMNLAAAALKHLPDDGCIIASGSVTGERGKASLPDYASTKGAIHAFSFSLAQRLAKRGIRVNVVAPGPIWTPLIPASFDADKVKEFGTQTPMGRPGQPAEVAPAFVFLASKDASYITGQIIDVNGGGHISA